MTEAIKSRHEILADMLAMYGTTTPMDIGSQPKHRRTVTEMTQSIHQNIQAAIEYLNTKSSIQQVRVKECKRFKIIRKTKQNLAIQITYGGNSRVISNAFNEKFYTTIGEAVDFLKKFDEYLVAGVFEPELTDLLQDLQNNAAHAREAKEKKKSSNIQQLKEVVEYARPNVVALLEKREEKVG